MKARRLAFWLGPAICLLFSSPVSSPPPSRRTPLMALNEWIGDGRSTLDLFGSGFVLLRFSRNPVDVASLVEVAANRRVPLRVVDIDDSKITDLYECKIVLVRPDGHVAWRGDVCPDDVDTLIDRIRGARAGQDPVSTT